MKFAKATKFHRKSGEGLGIDPEDDPSAVGAALNQAASTEAANRARQAQLSFAAQGRDRI